MSSDSRAPLHAKTSLCLIHFTCWGLPLAFGTYNEYYFNSRFFPTATLPQIVSIGATQLAFLFLSAVPAGRFVLLNKYYSTVIPAAVIAAVLQFIILECTQWWQVLILQGVLQGFCLGAILTAGTISCATYWGNDLEKVAASATAFGPVGGIVYTVITRRYFIANDFRQGCIVSGVVVLLTLLPALLLTRPNKSRRFQEGESLGASKPIYSVPFLLMLFGQFCNLMGIFASYSFLVLYHTNILYRWPTGSYNILIFTLAASALGHLNAIYIVRRVGHARTATTASVLSAFSILGVAITPGSNVAGIACSILFGFFSGVYMSQWLRVIPVYGAVARGAKGLRGRMGLALTALTFAPLVGVLGGAMLVTMGGVDAGAMWIFVYYALCVGTGLLLLGIGFGKRVQRT